MASMYELLVSAIGDGRGALAADRLCAACVDLFEIDAAAVSLVFDGANSATLGVSGSKARVYDELQFTMGEGPCMDSVATRAPVMVEDLAGPGLRRWPAYGPALLAHEIRGVFALPILVAGQYLGALDLFTIAPGPLDVDQLIGGMMAAELAELPILDLMTADLAAAVNDPDSTAWTELNRLTRAEVAQATGMLVAQLDVSASEALVRLRAHAYASGHSATEVANDILGRRLRLEPA